MTAPMDGRRARREQNVVAVADAVLELLSEGDLQPGAADIAERSGVSLRSVFRYFDDLGSLQSAAIERHNERVDHFYQPLPARGSFDQRAANYAAHRVEHHEAVRHVARAAQMRAPLDPPVFDAIVRRRAQLRVQLDMLFAEELDRFGPDDRAQRLTLLEAATSFECLEYLREQPGVSVLDAVAASLRIHLSAS